MDVNNPSNVILASTVFWLLSSFHSSMPSDNKRNNPDSSPSKSPSTDQPSKAAKMASNESAELLTQSVPSSPASLPGKMSGMPDSALLSPTTDTIEELVQSELGKHKQLDENSRLIVQLTVSITARLMNNPTLLTTLSANQHNPQLPNWRNRLKVS